MSADAETEVRTHWQKRTVSSDVEKQPDDTISVPGLQTEEADHRKHFANIAEAKVLRKIDMHIVPVLCLPYLLAFLDRVNIANAAVFGLKQDLKLVGNQYNAALVVFFVPYILFEIPSNALLKRFKPHVWLPILLFLCGMVSMLQGLTKNFAGLVATRFFLGVVESGVFPACYYLISMWYTRAEAQKRYSFLFSSTSLAGGFGGLLASAIGNMDGARGYHGWRWVFILEGVATCLCSVLLFFIVSDFPEEATWLSVQEKDFVKARLYEDVGHSERHDPLTIKRAISILKDWRIFFSAMSYLSFLVPAYGYAFFAPAIIQTFGNSAIHTQLLTVPPWACSFVLAMTIATLSDWLRMRFVFILGAATLSLAGFVVLLVVHDDWRVQYAALFLSAMGMFSAMPIVICWYSSNLGGHHRRAVGIAFQLGFGNRGIVVVYAFVAKDAPKYIPGYSTCVAFLTLAIIVNTISFFGLSFENRRRDRLQAEGAYEDLTEQEKKRMGDLNPDYRYLT